MKKVLSAWSFARSMTQVIPTGDPSRQAISTYDGSGRKPRNTEYGICSVLPSASGASFHVATVTS